jgi:selenide,water dikinase
MQNETQPVLRDIVLIGGGHSHVAVLKRFGMKPVPGVRLTLICRDTHTPYSGMLPGYVAGHYAYDDVHIDLDRLAAFAGARFLRADATGLDRHAQEVQCVDRPSVPYDLLSINIGSTPQLAAVAGAAGNAVPVKPIHGFNGRWQRILQDMRQHPGPRCIAVVGGGAGGVELTLAIQYRLRNELRAAGRDPDQLEMHLFNAEESVLTSHNGRVRRLFAAQLAERGVHVHDNARVVSVEGGRVEAANGDRVSADEVVWVTDAGGAAWLAETGLALDANGFIRVRNTLQSVTDDKVFAAGDIAAMENHPRPKSGVFAVRQGPPLAANLRRMVRGRRPRRFRPQSDWLALISTGDRHAIASRGRWGFGGDWVWRVKHFIDTRFMRKYSDLPPMEDEDGGKLSVQLEGEEAQQAISAVAMRCGGCGAKVGAGTLANALNALQPIERDDVLVGLHAPDDAAIMRVPAGKALVHTVDFFRAFVADPYIFGQIAANHALGDIFAMGAEAQSATAIATVPAGLERKIEDTVRQLMAGALVTLNDAGCALVGGHTGEGAELALGFAINGLIDDQGEAGLRKGGMRPGDALIITKALGTGTLFAAQPRLAARGRWIDGALASMRQSNRAAADVLTDHGANACTDITGFGLLGHLVEMTRPSGVDAEIDLAALPLLEGAEETVAAGVLSSLQPANVRLRRALRNQAEMVDHPRYPLIFDPQTAGGLLASVPGGRARACVDALVAAGYPHAAVIGRVAVQGEPLEPIVLNDRAPAPTPPVRRSA